MTDQQKEIVDIDVITTAILDASIEVHRELGPGLIESVYEALLAHVLTQRGFSVRRQVPVRIEFRGVAIDEAFRADLIVDGRVIVELKAVSRQDPVFARQLFTYLRVTRLQVGLLINFGQLTLLAGVKRIVNGLPDSGATRIRAAARPGHHATRHG
jgi:GxxExxY protein